jgi:hypothetical protein
MGNVHSILGSFKGKLDKVGLKEKNSAFKIPYT